MSALQRCVFPVGSSIVLPVTCNPCMMLIHKLTGIDDSSLVRHGCEPSASSLCQLWKKLSELLYSKIHAVTGGTHLPDFASRPCCTMRFGSTAQVLLNCKLKYYRISECAASCADSQTVCDIMSVQTVLLLASCLCILQSLRGFVVASIWLSIPHDCVYINAST